MPELTIKIHGALLNVIRREITTDQERLILKVLDVTDITGDPERMEYDMDLALEELRKPDVPFEQLSDDDKRHFADGWLSKGGN